MTNTCSNGHASEWADFCSVCGESLQAATGPGGPPGGQADGAGAPSAAAAGAAAGRAAVAGATVPGPGPSDGGQGPGPELTCPNCSYARDALDVFCESCGFDFIAGTLPGPPTVVPAAVPAAAGDTGTPLDAGAATASGGAAATSGGAATASGSWWARVEADRAYYDREHHGGPVDFPDPLPGSQTVALLGEVVRIGRRSTSRGLNPEIDLGGPPEDPAVSHRHAELRRQSDGSYALVDVGSTNGTRLNDNRDAIVPDTPVRLADGDRVYLGAWSCLTVERRA